MSRSYLFVPADSERKLAKAGDSAADALIVDLEDSVAASARAAARELAREFIRGREDCWVRINPIDSPDALADLAAVMPGAPVGICLPKPDDVDAALELSKALDALESEHGLAPGLTKILPIVTERPRALFALDSYAANVPRLAALSWGAEDLSSAVGASANKGSDGRWLAPYEMARSLCLFAAAAAGVAAVDTVYTDFRDAEGLRNFAGRARRDGFAGMLAIHPQQLPIINDAFTPTADEIAWARRVVEAFERQPDKGVFAIDGEMVDRPHLGQAERIIGIADKLERANSD